MLPFRNPIDERPLLMVVDDSLGSRSDFRVLRQPAWKPALAGLLAVLVDGDNASRGDRAVAIERGRRSKSVALAPSEMANVVRQPTHSSQEHRASPVDCNAKFAVSP